MKRGFGCWPSMTTSCVTLPGGGGYRNDHNGTQKVSELSIGGVQQLGQIVPQALPGWLLPDIEALGQGRDILLTVRFQQLAEVVFIRLHQTAPDGDATGSLPDADLAGGLSRSGLVNGGLGIFILGFSLIMADDNEEVNNNLLNNISNPIKTKWLFFGFRM